MAGLDGYLERLRDLPKPATEWGRLFALAAGVGIAAGLAAAGLEAGLYWGSKLIIERFVDFTTIDFVRFDWRLIVLPACGGLVSGILVRWLAPTAIGHGTDTLIRAFHRDGGDLGLRGPVVKGVAAVGVISCGGSAGPEGPIAAIGAAIGSSFGRWLNLTPRERRIMLIAGCSAGVGAIFQCPMGGALFGAGVLYRDPDYEADAIVPAAVAAGLGYATYMPIWGSHFPLLGSASGLMFKHPVELIPYIFLGVVCGLFCLLLHWCLRFVENRPLSRLRMPRWFAPALGGALTGVVACVVPQVMDSQYAFIRGALDGSLVAQFDLLSTWGLATIFLIVALAKCVATALTVGSGASGGVLGPSVFIGGCAGAFVGSAFAAIAPSWMPEELRVALIPVGMAGLLAATMRVPLASIVMVGEMTGGWGLIVPAMLVCVSGYVIGRRGGLNVEQVRSSAESPAHAGDTIVHMLEKWRVRDLMQEHWRETVPPGATLTEIVKLIEPGTRPVFAVTERERIVGLISLPDIERIMDDPAVGTVIIAADIMSEALVTVSPDDDVYHALTLMARDNHIVMPVVTAGTTPRFVGMLSRHDVYEAVRNQLDEMRQSLLLEHEGLAAIDREEGLHHLVMGVSAPKTDNIQRLLVPIQAVGRSLRESDFRREFGVQVIAIEQPDGTLDCPPDPDAPLQTTQRLVAIVLDAPGGDVSGDGPVEGESTGEGEGSAEP